jgi:hypothetical protein
VLLYILEVHLGRVFWGGPTILPFGENLDGQLQVQLSNEIFNIGLFGLREGERFGATVDATFTLLQEASTGSPADTEPGSPDVHVNPEPTTVVVWLGLIGLLAAGRRRFFAST